MLGEAIGRKSERAFIYRFLDDVPGGPASLLVLGEAGIGKTTLWKDALVEAGRRAYITLVCRPVEAEARLSYASLGDLLGGVLDRTLPSLPEPQRHALELALLRAPVSGRGPDQRAVSVAVAGVLRMLASESPVLVAVDEVRWLDRPSATVLRFVMRRVEGEPIGILATARGAGPDDDAFDLSRSWPESRLRTLVVGPLDVDAIDEIVRARLDARLERSTLLRLHRAAGGNPFYALEIARALVVHGIELQPGGNLPVPKSLRDLLSQRLARVGTEARDSLRIVALLDHPTISLVERALGSAGRQTALDRAVSAGVVLVEDEAVRFTHPLFASVVEEETPPDLRRRLHRRLAKLVSDAEERARHLALATEQPSAAAAAALDEGAERALSRGAPDAAAELWDLAGRLTPPNDVAAVLRRASLSAEAHSRAGDVATAERLWREVVSMSSPGPERGAALDKLGEVTAQARGWQGAVPIFTHALSEVGADSALRAEVECNLAYSFLFLGRLREAQDHARAAFDLVEDLDDAPALGEAIQALGFIRFALGGGTQDSFFARGITPESEAGLPLVASPSFAYAQLLKYSDRLEASRARFLALLARAEESGDESSPPSLHYHLAELECWGGRLAEASRHADEAMKTGQQSGADFFLAMALYSRALVDAYLGDVARARDLATEGVSLSRRIGVAWTEIQNAGVLGFLALSTGDPIGADRHLGEADDRMSAMGVVEPGLFRIVPDRIDALVALGRLDEAESRLQLFERHAVELDRTWALATAARCKALQEAARGDLERAAETLDRAVELHEGLDQPFEAARTLLVRGTVERRAKRRGDARATLESARALFEGLGTRLWSQAAQDELARIGGRAPSRWDLTGAERRVADLVAEGRTNREVAAALFVSENTVRSSLKSIFRKLGIRSRAELARRLRDPTTA
jgi:DNA-binding CsgD family transcriptional regulator